MDREFYLEIAIGYIRDRVYDICDEMEMKDKSICLFGIDSNFEKEFYENKDILNYINSYDYKYIKRYRQSHHNKKVRKTVLKFILKNNNMPKFINSLSIKVYNKSIEKLAIYDGILIDCSGSCR